MRGRCRPLRALGRHHPGHHGHRAGAAAARGARADRAGSRGHRGGAETWRAATATRRWPGAPTPSTRCRSPSASSARCGSPPVQRHAERLARLSAEIAVVQFGGAVGTLASLGADGIRVMEALAAELGLRTPPIAWHVGRDGLAEVASFLGLLTGSLGKIATDVALLMQAEIGEVAEPYQEDAAAAAPCRRSATRSPASSSSPAPRTCASWSRSCWTPWCRTTSARPARGTPSGSRCRRRSRSPPARCTTPARCSRAWSSIRRACGAIST